MLRLPQQRDVDAGRHELNFSEWQRPQEEAHEAVELLADGEMPPWFYVALHPTARLTTAERQELAAGLRATLRDATGSGRDGNE